MRWPDGFLWGTGASSTQCEGAAPASDWWDWERAGRAPISGDGNGFARRHAEDFAILAGLGLVHHRLSIEWARVEPAAGVHDPAAVAHYRDVLTAAREAGIQPWVCLHHFTLPRWFADRGGFLVERNRAETWARHVDWMAGTFGDLVAGWQPVNETNIHARIAYEGASYPPGLGDPTAWAPATIAIHLATGEAAARLRQTGAPVASIFALSDVVAHDDTPRTRAFVERFDATDWAPWIGLVRDGVLRVPGHPPIERPDLAGSFDIVGFSYYSTLGVRDGQIAVHPPGAPVSPLGHGIWADGLRLVIDRLHRELPGTPLLVAEYGIGTSDDAVRADYLARGLAIANDAIARGVPLRGFFHWTAVDNYEWNHGYDVAFGIIDRERNVRPSALVLEREARPA